MKLLLDTQLILWAAKDSDRLSLEAREIISDPDNELLFSPINIWEITIKNALRRQDFKANPRLIRRAMLDNGYLELPMHSEHAITVDTLPAVHKDPFDRILIAQAKAEGILLLTADSLLEQYGEPVRVV
ncbi:type II toxin-antitoxin system VapC family toxin [Thalassospira sp. HF15]|uniref:type II toxin-antitoxin system VapC family toxin n=1 Tax=Thalassospira sp. HF15 TaxID=2722755 RepID=UPI001430B635|nr:type II toxin-antitoxin system VapC family toxin [Thalassospira sp. HF15]NIY76911.1 type II toxin-antitoxin system VapC family toxin [Thalassospira sp. HF15]